jgi:16S rRNA (cytidine1402-2'-O)-methyltransferase
LIAAEDTRTTRVLLQHYQITTPLTSYHEHNKLLKLDVIFEALTKGDVALVSDAGTPGISDPGYELIQAAIARGYKIEPLPGANAILPALVGSGLPTDEFVYLGFLPRKDKARRELFELLAQEQRTLVAYESPNRLVETLQAIQQAFGERQICVARELSKVYEEFRRGLVSEVLAHYQANPPRGEITLVIGGVVTKDEVWAEDQVRDALRLRLEAGESLSSASKEVAVESGWDKRTVYSLGTDYRSQNRPRNSE